MTESTGIEEGVVGGSALVADTIPFANCTGQALDRPVLVRESLRFEHLLRCVLPELLTQFFDLCCRQFGSIPTIPLVDQASDALFAIDSTPAHQRAATASSDRFYLLHWIAGSIQSHGLVSGSRRAIFASVERIEQLLGLSFCKFEFSLCHAYIVQLLSGLSIRTRVGGR